MTLEQAIEPAEPQTPELPKPDRHNLDFEFQIVPPGLREEDADAYQKLRFAAMVDLLGFETDDLPRQTRHAMKAKAANFTNFLANTRNGIRHDMPPANKRVFNFWVDNLAAMGWNVLDSYFQAKDQRVFVHLINLFNAGHIQLPGCDKPLSQCTFDEVIAAENLQAELYWKQMQREGCFIALTTEDLVSGSETKPLEEVELVDFKLPRAAIEKADLIAYQAPDGRRLVLKDRTGQPDVQPQ